MAGPVQLIIVVIVLGVPIAVIAAIIAMATKKRSIENTEEKKEDTAMRALLKIIGFLLAMMAFGVYGQFVQAIFASAAKANAGIGLVVAAMFYPVAILLPNVFLWRLFWGVRARNVIAYLSGLFIVPKIVSTINEIDQAINWQHLMNDGLFAHNVMHDEFRPYAIASWIIAFVWGIVLIECFKRPDYTWQQKMLRYAPFAILVAVSSFSIIERV